MSITFSANTPSVHVTSNEEPCLCAQMAECFCDAFDNGITEAHRVELAAEAWSRVAGETWGDCPHCGGTGVERIETDDTPSLNLNESNSRLLLAVMDIPFDHCGELSLAEARRGVMRARNRSSLSAFERPEEVVHGRPRANQDGSVELRPLRSHSMGLSAEDLLSRVERFSAVVEEAADRGATKVTWG